MSAEPVRSPAALRQFPASSLLRHPVIVLGHDGDSSLGPVELRRAFSGQQIVGLRADAPPDAAAMALDGARLLTSRGQRRSAESCRWRPRPPPGGRCTPAARAARVPHARRQNPVIRRDGPPMSRSAVNPRASPLNAASCVAPVEAIFAHVRNPHVQEPQLGRRLDGGCRLWLFSPSGSRPVFRSVRRQTRMPSSRTEAPAG